MTLAPGETRDIGTITLGAATTARGVRTGFGTLLVVASDERGRPVPEALCALEGLGIYGLAGPDGVARLSAVPGTYTVACQKEGHQTSRRRGVEIPDDGGLASMALELPTRRTWGSLIVDVVDRDARPIAGAGLDVWTYERSAGALYTDERGHVRFEATDCVGLQAFHANFEPSIPFQACPNFLEGKENYYLLTMCSGDECPPVWACLNGTRDCTPPETIISDAPPLAVTDTGAEADGVFVFAFGADEASTYFCRLDEGEWEACTTPYTVDNLPYGLHTLRVYAVDAEGNADRTPAAVVWSWQVAAELWLHVENCWVSGSTGCGAHDVLNRSGWSFDTMWLHVATTPDLAYKYPSGTTGAFHIRTSWLPPGTHEVAFNVGDLPNFGETMNNTRWLFGFDYVEGPGIPGGGYPFHSQKSWFLIEYGDGTTAYVALNCDYNSLVLIDFTRPQYWDAHVGRGRALMTKGYDGRLSLVPFGNPDYYTWYFENYMTWYNDTCLEATSFQAAVTNP